MDPATPDLADAYQAIRCCLTKILNRDTPISTSQDCKHELFMLKSWLDDRYGDLPRFPEEDVWEQQRTIDILKKKD